MKKHLLIAGLICVATIPPATAVTKCVKLSSSTTCSNVSGKGSDWSMTCNGVSVSGVSFCSNQKGEDLGATATSLSMASSIDSNGYCWCRMISPAVSQWVYFGVINGSVSAAITCSSCSNYCASIIRANETTRSAMFSNLSD